MKLHKFYHSVPFKCPFCFTFKEIPADFIDHLTSVHYSDVKLLYERKSSKLIIQQANKRNGFLLQDGDDDENIQDELGSEKDPVELLHNDQDADADVEQSEKNVNNNHECDETEETERDEKKKQRPIRSSNEQIEDEDDDLNEQDFDEDNVDEDDEDEEEDDEEEEDEMVKRTDADLNAVEGTTTPPQTPSQTLMPSSSPRSSASLSSSSSSSSSSSTSSKLSKANESNEHMKSSNSFLPPRKQQRLLSKTSQLESEKAMSEFYESLNGKANDFNDDLKSYLNHALSQSQFKQANDSNTFIQQIQKYQHHQQQQSKQTLETTNESSMKCAICDRGFEYYSNLRRHIKTKHKIFGKQVKDFVVRQIGNNFSSTQPSTTTSDALSQLPHSFMRPLVSSSSHSANNLVNSQNNSDQLSAANTVANMFPLVHNLNQQMNKLNATSNLSSSASSSSSSSSSTVNQIENDEDMEKVESVSTKSSSSLASSVHDSTSLNTTSASTFKFANNSNNKFSNLNTTLAAIAAAAAAAAAASSGESMNKNSSQFNQPVQQQQQQQQQQLLFNNKLKSSLIESLLTRKFQQQACTNDAQQVLNQENLSQPNLAGNQSDKINNLTKLIQNIVEMNQYNTSIASTNGLNPSTCLKKAASNRDELHENENESMDHQQSVYSTSSKNGKKLELFAGAFQPLKTQCKHKLSKRILNQQDLEKTNDQGEGQDDMNNSIRNDVQDEEIDDYDSDLNKEHEQLNDNEDLNGNHENNVSNINNSGCFDDDEHDEPNNESNMFAANRFQSQFPTSLASQLALENHIRNLTTQSNSFLLNNSQTYPLNFNNQPLTSDHHASLTHHGSFALNPHLNPFNFHNFHSNQFDINQLNTCSSKRKNNNKHSSTLFNTSNNSDASITPPPSCSSSSTTFTSTPAHVNTNRQSQKGNQSSSLSSSSSSSSSSSPSSTNQNATNNASNSNQNIRFSSEIWRCPYCCYETTSASRYNSHLVCHGWKPYLCPHCGSRSNRLPDMRTHISTFHPEYNVNTFVVLNEEEAKATLKDYMKNRALINRKLKEMRPQPKFKCKLCPYASLYQFNLTKHVKSVHLSDVYNASSNQNAIKADS